LLGPRPERIALCELSSAGMAISPMTARIGLRAEGRSIAFPYPGPLVAHGAAFVRVAAECRARPATGPAALRRMWDAMAPLYATAAEDPALPPELLSANWPGKVLRLTSW